MTTTRRRRRRPRRRRLPRRRRPTPRRTRRRDEAAAVAPPVPRRRPRRLRRPRRAAGEYRARAARPGRARRGRCGRAARRGLRRLCLGRAAPIVPADAGRADGGRLGALFLVLLVAAFASYLRRSCSCGGDPGSSGDARRGGRDPTPPARRAAAALDRRLGVLGVRPDRSRPRRQSLRGHAERVPGRPRLRRRRRRLARDDVGVRAGLHAGHGGRGARVRLVGCRGGVDLQGAGCARRARLRVLAARLARDRPMPRRSSAGTLSSRSISRVAATTTRS